MSLHLPCYLRGLRIAALRCVALASLALCGCGLADYEDRLKEERERVKAIEQENKLLGEPLEMPAPKEGEGEALAFGLQQGTVFFRPPKVLAIKPQPEGAVGSGKVVSLFGYGGGDHGKILLTGFESKHDSPETEFASAVWLAFQKFLGSRTLQQPVPSNLPELKKDVRKPPRIANEAPGPLEFGTCVFDEPGWPGANTGWRYLFYFHRNGKMHLAIIYQVPLQRTEETAIKTGIDASLKSLALGAEAAKRYTLYAKEKRAK